MLIDLDAPPPAPRPRPDPRPRARKAGSWAVAALFTMLLGGAAVPPRLPGLVPVSSTAGRPALGRLLAPTRLFVERRTVTATRSTVYVDAIPLAPGVRPWTFQFAGSGGALTLDRSGTVLVVEGDDTGETFFLDTATGAVKLHLWIGDSTIAGGRALMASSGKLRLVDLATGSTRWARDAEAVGPISTDADGPYAVSVDDQGRVNVYATADGRRLARAGVGVPDDDWYGAYPEPYADLQVEGNRLYVYGNTYLGAYRLPDLHREWRIRPAVTPVLLAGCGGRLCVHDETGVAVLDPATGRTVWSSGQWRVLSDDGLAVTGGGRAARLDMATGRVVRELGNGQPAGRVMVLADGDERVWVADLASGRLLGRLTGVTPQGCTSRGDYLACVTAGATVTVWRIPAAS